MPGCYLLRLAHVIRNVALRECCECFEDAAAILCFWATATFETPPQRLLEASAAPHNPRHVPSIVPWSCGGFLVPSTGSARNPRADWTGNSNPNAQIRFTTSIFDCVSSTRVNAQPVVQRRAEVGRKWTRVGARTTHDFTTPQRLENPLKFRSEGRYGRSWDWSRVA